MVGSRNSRASALVLALFLLISLLAVITVTPGAADAAVPGTNGKIIYEHNTGGDNSDLWMMNADGTGEAEFYTGAASIESHPVWSPKGDKIAFSSTQATVDATGQSIWLVNANGSAPVQLTKEPDLDDSQPAWSPNGNWIAFQRNNKFVNDGTAITGTTGLTLVIGPPDDFVGVAVGMEVDVFRASVEIGTAVVASVDSPTQITLASPTPVFTLAVDDTFVIDRDRYELWLMKPDGTGLRNLSADVAAGGTEVYSDLQPAWSPDGTKLAFTSGRGGSLDIYVATIDQGAATPTLSGLTNLTDTFIYDSQAPAWSPKGDKIAFQTQATALKDNIYVMNVDGSAKTAVTNTLNFDSDPDWSPDGTTIIFHRTLDPGPGEDVYSVPAAGGAETALTGAPAMERHPTYQRLLVATDDAYPIVAGGSINATAPGVMGNDVGLGGNPLATASVVSAPTQSTAFAFNGDGSFTYTHNGSGNDDSFTYKVTTASGESNTATVSITIPGNPPVANPDTYDVDKGGSLTVPAPGVLGNDTDSEDGTPGGAVLKTGPTNAASFTLNANGSFTYVHDGSAGTTDTFTYQAKDSGNKLSNVATVTITITSEVHTVVLVDPSQGMWHVYDAAGVEKTSFFFGNPGDYPIYGDWNCDGIETPGMYRQSDGYVYLRNTNTQGPGDIRFFFGNPGDVPIAGDFDGDGCDTVSIYRPAVQTFFIINKLGANDGGLGAADFSYVFGNPGDKPFVGDFDGDGVETVGLHRESTGLVYFRNSHTQGNADNEFIFGDPGDRLVAGDWNGNGVFSPALFRPSNTTMYFRYTNTQGNADAQWVGGSTSWLPVSGNNGFG